MRVERFTATHSSRPCSNHGAALAERLVEDEASSDGPITPVFCAARDELVGRDQPALGVLPADERLDAPDLARAEVGLRLVVQEELAAARSRAASSVRSVRRSGL